MVTFRTTPSPIYDLVCEVRDTIAEMRPETKMRILGGVDQPDGHLLEVRRVELS
jgi:hypothetical protein